MALLLAVMPQTAEAFGSVAVVMVIFFILAILWLILPFLLIAMNIKLGKIEKTLRETHHVIQAQRSVLNEMREIARLYMESGQGKDEK